MSRQGQLSRCFLLASLFGCEAPTSSLDEGPPDLDLYYLDSAREWHPIETTLPIYGGPAGGFFTFMGVGVVNLDPVDLEQEWTLVHGDRTLVDSRITSSAGPLIFELCPVYGVDLHEASISLSVSVVDSNGIGASKMLSVVPRCAEPELEALCRCQCSAAFPDC